MPVPISSQGAGGDAGDRVPMLERELGRLRREVEALRGQSGADHGRAALMGWLTTGMAAFGVLLGLIALLRH